MIKEKITQLMILFTVCIFSTQADAAKVSEPSSTNVFDGSEPYINDDPFSKSVEDSNGFLSPYSTFLDTDVGADLAKQGLDKIKKGEREQGLNDLLKAWQMNPGMLNVGVVITVTYLKDKHYKEALITAQKIQEIFPKNHVGYTLAGIGYSQKGDTNKAIDLFKKALSIKPGDSDTTRNLALLLLKNDENKDEALNLYREAHKLNPGEVSLAIELAKLEFVANNQELGMAEMEKISQENPELLQPGFQLARMNFVRGNIKKSLEITEPLLKKYPDNVALLTFVGNAKLKNSAPESALAVFKQAIQKSPDNFLLYNYSAEAYLQINDKQHAIEMIQKALSIQPEHAPSLFLFANILMQENKLSEAREIVQKLQNRYPERTDILELNSRIALKDNRPKDSIPLLQKAIKLQNSVNFALQLSMAYQAAGDKEAGFQVLRDWLNKFPSDVTVRGVLAELLRTNSKFDEAQKHYMELMKLRPQSVAIYNNLAGILVKKNGLDEALKYAKKAYELDPKSPQVMDTLAGVYLKRKEMQKAEELLLSANKISPEDLEIQFHLAQVYVQANQPIKAKELLSKLLATGGKFSGRNQAEQLLETIN